MICQNNAEQITREREPPIPSPELLQGDEHYGTKHGLKNYQYPDKFGKMLGYRVTVADKRKFRAETVLRRSRGSPFTRPSVLHGGVVSAFFDYSMGAAVFTTLNPLDFCSTVELKVNYLKPILLGDFLPSKTEVMFRGKRLCVVRGLIYRNNEKGPGGNGIGNVQYRFWRRGDQGALKKALREVHAPQSTIEVTESLE